MCNECRLSFTSGGDVIWVDDDEELHCLDGPAMITRYYGAVYCCHGQRHRVGGPARIWPSGTVEYWENGKFVRDAHV